MLKYFQCLISMLFVAIACVGTSLSIVLISPEVISINQGLLIILIQVGLNLYIIGKFVFGESYEKT